MLPSLGDNAEWQEICRKLAEADRARATVAEFATMLGLSRGVTGYAYHAVPVAVYAFIRHGADFRETLTSVLNCGGDTDTVGAIVGALVGANVGAAGIPSEWLNGIVDWPRSVAVLNALARELSAPIGKGKPVRYFWPGILPRNLVFWRLSWHTDSAAYFLPTDNPLVRLSRQARILGILQTSGKKMR